MDWFELVRYLGIALSILSGLWLWALRRRRQLNWISGIGGFFLMALGVVADFYPSALLLVLCFPTLVFDVIYVAVQCLLSPRKGACSRWDISSGIHTREDIEFELAKKEYWAQSVHRP